MAQNAHSAHTQQRKEDAHYASANSQQHALRQQLADDAAATCAQGCANGELLLAGDGTRQQEIGDIGTGDQQKAAHGSQQDK